MTTTRTVQVPDIGDFRDVDVVEVLVSVGEHVEADQSLIVLESDKASMEVPAPAAGVVRELHVAVDAKVSEGDPICTLESGDDAAPEPTAPPDAAPAAPPAEAAAPAAIGAGAGPADASDAVDVVVLGGGPGGYTAAFRAADLGKQVVLIERDATLGGVCLNVGCIPSKALLHVAAVLDDARDAEEAGIRFGPAEIDLDQLRAYKNGVVGRLTGGLAKLAEQRGVEVVRGSGSFTAAHEIEVTGEEDTRRIAFRDAIVAVGSEATTLPNLPQDARIMDSTRALEVEGPPGHLLVVGGGIIGLEMATVYLALGWQVSIVEMLDRIMVEADRDLVRPLEKRLRPRLAALYTKTSVVDVDARQDGVWVRFEGSDAPESACFDRVLVAVGRRPNGRVIGAERAGVHVDERGFVPADASQRTNVAHIYAIGDVTGPPLLAHRATHQGKVAAEVIAGLPSRFDPTAIPAVAYTDPEVAWTGLTEALAKERGVAVRKAVFPWAASGRALGSGRAEGTTKLLFSEEDGRLVGAGITGRHADDLISEAQLAIEMGADAEDLALTVHPHPTLSETIAFAAEIAHGSITDLMPPRRR